MPLQNMKCSPSWMDKMLLTIRQLSQTPIDNLHYTAMPFGIKNAEATYKRVMTVIFHDILRFKDYVITLW